MENGVLIFSEVVNIKDLEELFQAFTDATGFSTGLVEQGTNKVLIATGWKNICKNFHRANPESLKNCIASNMKLTENLNTPGEIRIHKCKNGLIDGCTPIIVEGFHLATLFTGQVFFKKPDILFFKKQIEKYNYNQELYLSALSEVPVVNEYTFKQMLNFLAMMAIILANAGLDRLKLKESEKRFATIFETAPDGILVADIKTGKITNANKSACKMLGYNRSEILNLHFTDLHPENDIPYIKEIFKKQLNRKLCLAHDLPVKRKDGRIFYADINSQPMTIRGKKYLVGIFRDISEKKKTEKELLKIKKLESIGILAGGIAHDFNNILSSILGNIELANITTNSNSTTKKFLQKALEATLAAKELTHQLLTFSKGGEPVKQLSSIKKIIEDSVKFVLHGTSLICEFNISDNLWPVEVDSSQLSRVIQNIILNARDSMPEGGTIKVTCYNTFGKNEHFPVEDSEYVKIIISDSGQGIPEEYIDKIFDPYFSTKSSKDKERSGLGLTICHSIIKKHNGEIFVKSEINKGTEFIIFLPAVPNPDLSVKNDSKKTDKLSQIQSSKYLLFMFSRLIMNISFNNNNYICSLPKPTQ